jgi:hypothetical protein
MEEPSKMETLHLKRDRAFDQRNIESKSKLFISGETLEKVADKIRGIYDGSGIYCVVIREIRYAANKVLYPISRPEFIHRTRGLALQYLAGLVDNNSQIKEMAREILPMITLESLSYRINETRESMANSNNLGIKTRYKQNNALDTISFFFYGHV